MTLWQPVIYHFKSDGKRWRPYLVRVIGKLYQVPEAACELLEVIVELTHNWTLIHDDIEDGDILRRGKLTVWKKFGLDYGINCGDAMFALSFKILENGEKIWGKKNTLFLLKSLSETLIGLSEGQNLEFDFRKKKNNIKISDYMRVVKRKTTLLPKFGVIGIAKIAGASKKETKALEKFCDNIFPAFQIKDDILNLIGKREYGKEIGSDIKEGKRTVPLIYLLNKVSQKEKKEILRIILKERKKTTKKEVEKVIKLMKKTNSFEYSLSFIEKLIEKGKKSLPLLPGFPERQILQELSDWLAQGRIY